MVNKSIISIIVIAIFLLAQLPSSLAAEEQAVPLWGGENPKEAHDYKIPFGKDGGESEQIWFNQIRDHWFYTETNKQGTLYFEITDIDAKSDIDLYVYDWIADKRLCPNSQSGNSKKKCSIEKNNNNNWGFMIKIVPKKIQGNVDKITIHTYVEEWVCKLDNAYWDKTSATEGDRINAIVKGNDFCDGKQVSFEVWEEDTFSGHDPSKRSPPPVNFNRDTATGTWKAEWEDDERGNPEWYFIAKINDGSSIKSSNKVDVEKQCTDSDGDGYYSEDECSGKQDCDDKDSSVYPGASEICDGKDNNCNQEIDEGLSTNTYYVDTDDDKYGSSLISITSCKQPEGYVARSNDCNDNNKNINPGASEICDKEDNNCNQLIDETFNLNSDNNNCGACGISCSSNQQCNNGWCISTQQCGNNICEQGETSLSCPQDCFQPECTSDGQCTSSQVCQNNICVDKPKNKDECSNHDKYYCKNGDVYQCSYNSNQKKYVEKLRDSCAGGDETCNIFKVQQLQQCEITPLDYKVSLEDADEGVKINKQKGDMVILHVNAESSGTIPVYYSKSDVELKEGSCNGNNVQIKAGDNVCKFKIITEKEFVIQVDKTPAKINVINPETLYITNKQKLYQRFANSNGVNDLLKQVYVRAGKDGVVYDLSQEFLSNHPFLQMGDYREDVLTPLVIDNTYSNEVAQFIQQKCGDCKNVIIIGDDYVVPHYRQFFNELSWNWFRKSIDTNSLYTDAAYIPRKAKTLNQFDEIFKIDGKYQGKDVLIISSYNIPSQEITYLKNVFNKEYKPDFDVLDPSQVTCNDLGRFSEFRGETLLIIGTEKDNRAFDCMPFVSGEANRDSVFLDINPWDSNQDAIIINTENPAVVHTFAQLIDSKQHLNLKSHNAYLFEISTETAGYVALGIGVTALAVGTGGAAPAALIVIAGIADGVADAADVANTCKINPEGFGWCGGTIALAVMPFVPSKATKSILKNFGDDILKNLPSSAKNNLINNFNILNKQFDKKILLQHNAEHLSKGTSIILGESSQNADQAIRAFRDSFGTTQQGREHAVKTLAKIGKYNDEIIKKGWVRFGSDVPLYRGVDVTGWDINKVFNNGFKARGSGEDLVAHYKSSNYPGRFISTSTDFNVASKKFATTDGLTEGYVFKVNPRAKNIIDMEDTLESSYVNKKLSDDDWVNVIIYEKEKPILDRIDSQDIEGVWKVDIKGNPVGNFIRNPNYIGGGS